MPVFTDKETESWRLSDWPKMVPLTREVEFLASRAMFLAFIISHYCCQAPRPSEEWVGERNRVRYVDCQEGVFAEKAGSGVYLGGLSSIKCCGYRDRDTPEFRWKLKWGHSWPLHIPFCW